MRHLQQLKFIDAVARAGSIRRAAESLAISSTALNRRILAMEEDLGTPIFERLPNGVRLSVAGELFIQYVRQQLSDIERVQSQIADLSGERRGHVSIVCGQALMQHFLPSMVAAYRQKHPGVSFSVLVGGRQDATTRLLDFSADIALVFDLEVLPGVRLLHHLPQRLQAVMTKDHPLADRSELRLSECAQFPFAVPSPRSGIRQLLDRAAARRSLELPIMIESDSASFLQKCLSESLMITFQLPVAFSAGVPEPGMRAIYINEQDVPKGSIQIAQQRDRNLPVAAARFAATLIESMADSMSTSVAVGVAGRA